ncbi:sphingomyelin synthase-related 1-like [Ciona intestinalis]
MTDILFKKQLKLVVAAALLQLSVESLTAYCAMVTSDWTPDRKQHPPLPDVILDNVTQRKWGMQLTEYVIVTTIVVNLINVAMKRNGLVILRRGFYLCAITVLYKAPLMLSTNLPVSATDMDCPPPMLTLTRRVASAIHYLIGGGMTINSVHCCGDYIFSGHTAHISMLMLIFIHNTRNRLIPFVSIFVSFVGYLSILLAHEHYTVDVLLALLVTSQTYFAFHVMNKIDNPPFMRKVLFPFYDYFEGNKSTNDELDQSLFEFVKFKLRHHEKITC